MKQDSAYEEKNKAMNIALSVTEFLAFGGVIYFFLGLLGLNDWIKMVIAAVGSAVFAVMILKRKSKKDVDKNQNPSWNLTQQSPGGRVISGYIKAEGYTNMVGIVILYILGGGLTLLGIFLAFLLKSPSAFFIIGGMGILFIIIAIFVSKASKKMREKGNYYQVGKGWTTPR